MKNELTAQRLSFALNRKGMNQQQLADISGVSKHSISQYIHGSHSPSNISAAKIGKILEVNPMWLMGYEVPMTGNSNEIVYNIHAEDQEILDAYHKLSIKEKNIIRAALGLKPIEL